MAFTPEMFEELNLLCLYNLDTTQEGIKVHSTADAQRVAAAQRLFERGLVTHPDGGYLTGLGHDAAEQAQRLLTIMATPAVTTG